jgi:hypothetical protein
MGLGNVLATVPLSFSFVFFLMFHSTISFGDITIDAAADAGPVTYRGSGMTHGFSRTAPADSLVLPLKIRFVRHGEWSGDNGGIQLNSSGGSDRLMYVRVVNSGGLPEIEMSSPKPAFQRSNCWPGDNNGCLVSHEGVNKTPEQAWKEVVGRIVNRSIANGYTKLMYDPWNEPDLAYMWGRSKEQWFQYIWLPAVRQIRAAQPNAVIVGPSVSTVGTGATPSAWIQAFLAFARANNVLPNRIAFHVNSAVPGHVSQGVTAVRSWMAANGYAPLPLEIGEVMGITQISSNQNGLTPAQAVLYFSELERSGVLNAGKSCWQEDTDPATGVALNDCTAGYLNGLLNSNMQPRSQWWAFKGYADITGRLVRLATTNGIHDGVAGIDAGTVRAVIGNYGATNANIVVQVKGLSGTSVRVTADAIPNSGMSALSAPSRILSADYPVNGGTAAVTLPVSAYGAATLVAVPAPAPAPTVDSTAPTVSIISPTNGAIVSTKIIP